MKHPRVLDIGSACVYLTLEDLEVLTNALNEGGYSILPNYPYLDSEDYEHHDQLEAMLKGKLAEIQRRMKDAI